MIIRYISTYLIPKICSVQIDEMNAALIFWISLKKNVQFNHIELAYNRNTQVMNRFSSPEF